MAPIPCVACTGITRLDHAVGNVPNLLEVLNYIVSFTGGRCCGGVGLGVNHNLCWHVNCRAA